MIEFEKQGENGWERVILHPDTISSVGWSEYESEVMEIIFKKDQGVLGIGIYLYEGEVKPSLQEIYDQISGKPKSNMISFEFIDQKDNPLKTYIEPSIIKRFSRTNNSLAILFYKEGFKDLIIHNHTTKESLEDIWQQLCEAKGISEEVKQ